MPALLRHPLVRALRLPLACVGLFAACLYLYTRHNDFPHRWHPDEHGKAHQIITGERNFNHPQLLLEATQLVLAVGPTKPGWQTVVEAGRFVSAMAAAGAVICLALAVFILDRWRGFAFAAVLLGLSPALVTFSHYMKEDACLIFGLSACVLAAATVYFVERHAAPQRRSHFLLTRAAWGFLGIACALTVSGKYVGVMSLALLPPLLLLASGAWWARLGRLVLALVLFALVLGIVNHRMLHDDPTHGLLSAEGRRGLMREIDHSRTSHTGLTADRPQLYMIRTAAEMTWPHALLPAVALPAILYATRRRPWAFHALVGYFFCACALVLSASAILFPRYALPLVILIELLAVLSLARLAWLLPASPRGAVAIALMLALFGVALLRIDLDYLDQFAHDSRTALHDWAAEHLPHHARIYADGYTDIGAGQFRQHRPDLRITTAMFCPDVFRFDERSRRRDTYIMIASFSYDRFFEPVAMPAPGHEAMTLRRRAFYEELLEHHTPIWSATPTRDMRGNTHPALRVYRLGPHAASDRSSTRVLP
jgi:MFS family permease